MNALILGRATKNARRHNQRLSINSPAPPSSNVDNIVDESQLYMIGRFFRTLKTNQHSSTLNFGGEGAVGKVCGSP